MSLQDDELPVLNAVVESGNPSIIQSTRMGNEVLRELETLRRDSARRVQAPLVQDTEEPDTAPENTSKSAKLPADVTEVKIANEQPAAVEIPQGLDFASLAMNATPSTETETATDAATEFRFSDDELELLIDDVVDRHITALRQDIKQLLERARRTP